MDKRLHIGLFLVAILGFGSLAGAGMSVLPGGSSVDGKTIAGYTTDWWNWDGSFVNGSDPFSDKTGAFATAHQSGPVFFVAGSTSSTPGAVTRSFNVPANTYLLVPVLNIVAVNGADPGFTSTAQEAHILGTTGFTPSKLFASLDGTAISNLASHREDSPQFTLNVGSANSPVGTPAGSFADANGTGYYLLFAPLAPGVHTLHFGGTTNSFDSPTHVHLLNPYSVNVTDTITVSGSSTGVPLPAAVWPALAIILGVVLRSGWLARQSRVGAF